MGSMKDHYLGDRPYPAEPGYKRAGTSQEAAAGVRNKSANLRGQVLAAIKQAGPDGLTADEAAKVINEPVLNVRPRLTELLRAGKIVETGQRRKNDSGATALVWRAV